MQWSWTITSFTGYNVITRGLVMCPPHSCNIPVHLVKRAWSLIGECILGHTKNTRSPSRKSWSTPATSPIILWCTSTGPAVKWRLAITPVTLVATHTSIWAELPTSLTIHCTFFWRKLEALPCVMTSCSTALAADPAPLVYLCKTSHSVCCILFPLGWTPLW